MALRELELMIRQLQLRISEMSKATPLGIIEPFAGANAPAGWLLCDGAAVSRTTYPGLFAVIGTTYGAGNGSTTFNVPNAKGRVLVGRDAAQSEFDALGETGGAKTHTLTVAEMPAHNHNLTNHPFTAFDPTGGGRVPGGDGAAVPDSGSARGDVISDRGGGQPHNNLQPYLTVNYIIRAA